MKFLHRIGVGIFYLKSALGTTVENHKRHDIFWFPIFITLKVESEKEKKKSE